MKWFLLVLSLQGGTAHIQMTDRHFAVRGDCLAAVSGLPDNVMAACASERQIAAVQQALAGQPR